MTREGKELAVEVLLRLIRNRSLEDLPVDLVDGRADLRGLWLGYPSRIPSVARGIHDAVLVKAARWQDIDFTWSSLPMYFEDSTITNCRFDHLEWPAWQSQSSLFTNCTFIRSRWEFASFDFPNDWMADKPLRASRTRYVRCDFTRSRFLSYAWCGRAIFEDCLFRDAHITRISFFVGADLVRCRFEGKFNEIRFGWHLESREPAPILQDVDVAAATFEFLEVEHIRGSGLVGQEHRNAQDARGGSGGSVP